jgi:hypothetical protein
LALTARDLLEHLRKFNGTIRALDRVGLRFKRRRTRSSERFLTGS